MDFDESILLIIIQFIFKIGNEIFTILNISIKNQNSVSTEIGDHMEDLERNNWVDNIQNSSRIATDYFGKDTVCSVFQKYHAHDVDDLDPCFYLDVFNDLYQLEVDI